MTGDIVYIQSTKYGFSFRYTTVPRAIIIKVRQRFIQIKLPGGRGELAKLVWKKVKGAARGLKYMSDWMDEGIKLKEYRIGVV
jgi:hypothetical protein